MIIIMRASLNAGLIYTLQYKVYVGTSNVLHCDSATELAFSLSSYIEYLLISNCTVMFYVQV